MLGNPRLLQSHLVLKMTKTCSQCAILFILILIQDCRCPRLLSIGPSWQVWWCDRSIENEHHPSHIWSFVRDVGMWVVSPCVPTVSWFALDRRNLRCPRMIYLHICTQSGPVPGVNLQIMSKPSCLGWHQRGFGWDSAAWSRRPWTTHKRAVYLPVTLLDYGCGQELHFALWAMGSTW